LRSRAPTPRKLRAQLDKLCRDLLSNPVIEDYQYEIAGK
jgi:phosphoribosylformylglycinamidine (FGAM) synthase PurS component